jgi:hypothetical protein
MVMNSGVINFHLTASSNRHVGITECRKLKCTIWRSDLRHNVHTKFQEYTSNHSLVIKCIKTGITRGCMRMRRGSYAMVSSPNVTSLCIQHVRVAICTILKAVFWIRPLNIVTSTLNTIKIRSCVHDMSKTAVRKEARPL